MRQPGSGATPASQRNIGSFLTGRRGFLATAGLVAAGLGGVACGAKADPAPTRSSSPSPSPSVGRRRGGGGDMRSWQVPCGPDGSPTGPLGTEKEIVQRLVTSAENSSLNWRAQFGYIEDIDDGRGYTAGIIGFTTGTGDLLDVVTRYVRLAPGNPLQPFVPALRAAKGSGTHDGLDGLPSIWARAAADPSFQQAQLEIRDEQYFDPAAGMATVDGLRALGRFCYCDAIVMHGPGDDSSSFGGIRAAALRAAEPPAKGGDESAYLNTFLDIRRKIMRRERGHSDTSRIDTAQRVFLQAANLDLRLPLRWSIYGDHYEITCA